MTNTMGLRREKCERLLQIETIHVQTATPISDRRHLSTPSDRRSSPLIPNVRYFEFQISEFQKANVARGKFGWNDWEICIRRDWIAEEEKK